jgi:hypothetical protein
MKMTHEMDGKIVKAWIGRTVRQTKATLPETQHYVGRVSVVDEAFFDEKGALHLHTKDGVWCPCSLVEIVGPKTFDELMAAVLEILPEATIGEDNDGQLVVYTGLKEVTDWEELARFEEDA